MEPEHAIGAMVATLINPRDSRHHRFVDDVADAFLDASQSLDALLHTSPFESDAIERMLSLTRTLSDQKFAIECVLSACATALAVGRARLRAEPLRSHSPGASPRGSDSAGASPDSSSADVLTSTA